MKTLAQHLTLLLGIVLSTNALAQEDRFAKVIIEPTNLGNGIYMLKGAGGNIGVSAGNDGILIVDDQFAPLADKIATALKDINPAPLKYVVNTHFHGDHTGSNGVFSKQAVIMAHDNVRVRLLQKENPDMAALPVVTYAQGVTVYINGESVVIEHLQPGHTDGDSIAYFSKANVLHAGDLFFNGLFPFIDLDNGGSVQGYIDNVRYMLTSFDDDVVIIPGHGPLANKQDLTHYLEMLEASAAQVKTWKAQGVTAEQAKTRGLDDKWKSWSWQFISEQRWIDTLYKGLN